MSYEIKTYNVPNGPTVTRSSRKLVTNTSLRQRIFQRYAKLAYKELIDFLENKRKEFVDIYKNPSEVSYDDISSKYLEREGLFDYDDPQTLRFKSKEFVNKYLQSPYFKKRIRIIVTQVIGEPNTPRENRIFESIVSKVEPYIINNINELHELLKTL